MPKFDFESFFQVAAHLDDGYVGWSVRYIMSGQNIIQQLTELTFK